MITADFMISQRPVLGIIPCLYFSSLNKFVFVSVDLWTFFKLSQEYGGYDMVSSLLMSAN